MAPSSSTQHYPALPVTQKYAQTSPDEFRETIQQTWQASQAILNMVADQVEGMLITPVQGAQVASAITGSLFGVQEFQRELRPSDLALLAWQRGNGHEQAGRQ